MSPSFRSAAILTATFAICGPALAQQIAPAGAGVTINKIVIDNGPAQTVKYYVTGGSPKLQALVRRVEWTENELSVMGQVQQLKLDTVVNERRIAGYRTAQLTSPYFPVGFSPFPVARDYGGYGESSLQGALTGQLTYEATPQAALQMIGYLEQMQTELDAQLKALPPQEKKAAQGPVDDLLPRLAALPRVDVPAPEPQPVVPPPLSAPAPTVPLQPPTPPGSAALQQTVRQYQQAVRQKIMQSLQPVIQR